MEKVCPRDPSQRPGAEIQWTNIAKITKRPSFFRGTIKLENYSQPVSYLRSWQHKESRRSDLCKLAQCVMLQAAGGYLLLPMDYFLYTIIPEDIGLANPDIIVSVNKLFEKHKIPKEWPLELPLIEKILSDSFRASQLVASSQKSRIIPSLATIAVLHFAKVGWSPKTSSFSVKTDTLKKMIRQKIQFSSDDMIQLAIALQDCLLHMEYQKAENKANKIRQKKFDLQKFIIDATYNASSRQKSIIQTIYKLNKSKDSRLLVYMLTFIAGLPENTWGNYKFDESKASVDLHLLFQNLFPVGKPLPTTPDYALDKHVGKRGGYEKFQNEGIYVPPEKSWQAQLNKSLSDQSFTMRFDYEKIHGENSSKTKKVMVQIFQGKAKMTKPKGTSKAPVMESDDDDDDDGRTSPFEKEEKVTKPTKEQVSKKRKRFHKKYVLDSDSDSENEPVIPLPPPISRKQEKRYVSGTDTDTSPVVLPPPSRTMKLLQPPKKKPKVEKKEKKAKVDKKPKKDKKEQKVQPMMQPVLDAPVGQTVTARFKKYVYIYPDVVKKGPYVTSKDLQQVKYIMQSTKLVDMINHEQGIPSTVIKPTKEQKEDGSIFLNWKNIGKYENVKTENRTTKLAENVNVVARGSLVYRASDVELKELSPALLQECLDHLYARAVVGVGDSGLWNILIENYARKNKQITGKAVGIDLEEKRSFKKTPETKVDFLFSKVHKREFWNPHMKQVKQISVEWAQAHLEPDMVERVKLFKSLPVQ